MRTSWAALVVLVVAGVAWFALRERDAGARRESGESTNARHEKAPSLTGSRPEPSEHERRRTGKLGGRVFRGDGSAAVGAEVTALRQGGEEAAGATAAPDGAFLLDGLELGFYKVRAAEGDQQFAEIWTNAGALDLRLTLTPVSDTLRLRVLGPDGVAVPRFDARLLLPSGYRKLDAPSEGGLAITGGAGQWTGALLEVWGARDASDRGLGYSPVRIGPLSSAHGELEVRMYEGHVLEGVVLGPNGPVADRLEVKLGPVDRWWETFLDDRLLDAGLASSSTALPQRLPFEGLAPNVRTNESGRFRIEFLRPGIVHVLDIDVPEGFHRVGPREVRVGDGPLEIRLQKPVTVKVTVLGPDQEPLKGVHVVAQSPGSNGFGTELESTTKADGTALLGGDTDLPWKRGGLDPDRQYKLVVNANYEPGIVRDLRLRRLMGREDEPRSPPFLAEKALDNWLPTDTTVRLERGYTVSGRVLDTNGRPLEDRHVGMCTSVGFGVYRTDSDGRFTFHGVPAGTIYMGLDDGGDMGGIVDRQRETMWDASFGPRQQYSPESPPPVREWSKLEVGGDLPDVTFRLPATIRAEFVLPPRLGEADPGPDELSLRRFDATRVVVIHQTEKGWEYFRSVNPALADVTGGGSDAVEVEGLLPGHTYAAWMTPVAGQYVYVEFPAAVGRLVLERKSGAAIGGRILDRPPDSSRVRIDVWDDCGRSLPTRTPDSEGGFRVLGLPESTWTVRAWCRSAADVVWLASEEVKTGGEVALRLAPQQKEDAE